MKEFAQYWKPNSKGLRILASMAFLSLLITQFNNCGGYTNQAVSEDSVAQVNCTTSNCVIADSTLLSVTPHLVSTGAYGVTAGLSEFNLGGDCNEGGYAANTIRWELMLNGKVVRTSDMPVAGGASANSKCINGRFLIYVNLAALPSGDLVNRTGLANGSGGRSSYDLWINLYGQSAAGGALDPSLEAQARVPLSAF